MKIVQRKKSGSKKYFFNNYDPEMEVNVTETAKSLDVSRQTIYRWINEIKSEE